MKMNEVRKRFGATWCSAPNCSNNSGQPEKRSFFRFPRDEILCRKWVVACRRADLDDKSSAYLYKNCRICSDHFEERMFLNDLKNRRHSHAVPTLFNIPNPPPRISSTRRHVKRKMECHELGSVAKKLKLASDESISMPCSSVARNDVGVESAAEILLSLSKTSGLPETVHVNEACPERVEDIQPVRRESLGSPVYYPRKKLRMLASKWRSRALRLNRAAYKRKSKPDYQAAPEVHCKCCVSNLPHMLQNFLAMFKKEEKVIHSQAVKKFALSVHFISPQTYKFLRGFLPLPTPRRLQQLISKVDVIPGLSMCMLNVLKLKVSTLSDLDKNCVLCIDEMSIKSNLSYSISKDEVTGFVDLGSGCRMKVLATSVLVFMIRGISANWKQPVSYHFVSESCPSTQIKPLLFQLIKELQKIGFLVSAVVSDMGSNFVELARNLGVTPDHPYFEFNGLKVHYLFDIPHLLKAFRNNLIKYSFKFFGKEAKWSDIERMYLHDKTLALRLAPKLFDCHIYLNGFSKMKVKYAAQVFSHSTAAALNTHVAMGLLPAKAQGTSDLIDNFDKIFDCVNSSTLYSSKKYRSALSDTSCHKKFILQMLLLLDELRVVDKHGKDISKSIKCLYGWKLSLSAILSIWECLKNKDFSFLLTRRLNQDALENFFCKIRQRGGNCDNPSANQSMSAFKQLSLQIQLHDSSTGNCSWDSDQCILSVKDLSDTVLTLSSAVHMKSDYSLSVQTQDYRYIQIPAQNGLLFVAGYVMRKCLQKHTCNKCTAFANENSNLNSSSQLFCYFKAYESEDRDFGGLCMPSESFVTFINEMNQIFSSLFSEMQHHPNLGHTILSKCSEVQFCHPCASFPKLYAMKLFIRMMICHSLKRVNKDEKLQLSLVKPRRTNRKLVKVMHS